VFFDVVSATAFVGQEKLQIEAFSSAWTIHPQIGSDEIRSIVRHRVEKRMAQDNPISH
jgi:hypothetical protein